LWEALSAADDPGAAVEWIRATWRPLEESVSRQIREFGPTAPAEARRTASEQAFAGSMQVLSHLEDTIAEAPWSVVAAVE
jgi:hypothetical protein